MAIRLDTAAKYIADKSHWRITNLALQKLLYLAQVEFIGKNDGERLVDTSFEAWDYGPVSPDLYHRLKMYGSSPIQDVFYDALNLRSNSLRREIIDEICDRYLGVPPGELIEVTHWERGAWASKYEPGVKKIPITDGDILREYRNREQFPKEWEQVNQ